MKHRTADLEGTLLDAAVALAEGILVTPEDDHPEQPGFYRKTREEWGEHIVRWFGSDGEEGGWEGISSWGAPSTEWGDGGPIIDREKISTVYCEPGTTAGDEWEAYIGCLDPRRLDNDPADGEGPTALIAAMRAYVASKLGEEVELP